MPTERPYVPIHCIKVNVEGKNELANLLK